MAFKSFNRVTKKNFNAYTICGSQEDINFLLNDHSFLSAEEIANQATKIYHANELVVGAVNHLVEELGFRLSSNVLLENIVPHYWITIDSAYASFEEFLRPLLDDQRYSSPPPKNSTCLQNGKSAIRSPFCHLSFV